MQFKSPQSDQPSQLGPDQYYSQWQQLTFSPPQQGTAYPLWQQQPEQHLYQPQQQQLPMQPNSLQQPHKKKHLRRNMSISFGSIVTLVILIVIIIAASSHNSSLTTATQQVPPPSPYPQLATAYSGNIQNASNGFSTTLRLDSITEDQQGNITGIILIANPTDGGNTFNGSVGSDKSITFTATITYLSSPATFTGSINQDGSISGTSSISGDTNATDMNTWKLRPVS